MDTAKFTCTYCNTAYKKDFSGTFFCPNCGYRPGTSTGSIAKESAKRKQEEEDEAKQKLKERYMLIAKIIIYLMLGGAVIYMLQIMVDMI